MKKIVSVLSLVLFSTIILLSSCQTNKTLCPAYQPSYRDGGASIELKNDNFGESSHVANLKDQNLSE